MPTRVFQKWTIPITGINIDLVLSIVIMNGLLVLVDKHILTIPNVEQNLMWKQRSLGKTLTIGSVILTIVVLVVL